MKTLLIRTVYYMGIFGCIFSLYTPAQGQDGSKRAYTLAEKSIQQAKVNLPQQVNTENPELTRLVHSLYADCLFDKLWEPALPGLPYRFFSITGAGDESYGKCQLQWDPMFVLNAWAPLDDNQVVYDVFRNYWNVIDNNPEAPKGSYRYGMVPCTTNPDLPQPGFSQIPILAWGCLMVFNQTNDRKLLDLCLPYLDKFLTWYATERDVDNDGLIEYGAYKESSIADLLQTARFETFDFHATLDDLRLTRHPTRGTGGEWYGNIEGVDQTSFLAMSERAMIEMCKRTGRTKMMEKYERLLAKRTEAIRTKMWDPETKFFYSLNRDTDKKIRIRTLQGFLTLTAGLASEEQAGELVRQLTDPSLFWSKYPITTSAMDEPTFKPDGFWRGDMWPPTNYLIALGLQRYGYHDISKKLTDKMLELVKKYDGHSYERYNGVEGTDLGVKDYCWGVAIWSMVVHTTYGVQEDYRTIVVPPHAKGRKLKLGKLEVSYPTDNSVELKTAFKRELKVVFPEETAEIRVQCDGKTVKSAKTTGAPSEAVFTAMPGKTYIVSNDHMATLSSKDQGLKLLGNRFFTFSTVVRVNQIEVTRDKNDGVDESGIHSPEAARKFRETIDKCWPGARITWTFSWLALKDQRSNYKEIRELVVSYHKKYGDEITFLPGGYFANMYNSREQVNRDLHEGLQMVSEMVGGGYRPKSVVAGFLSAENQRYLAEEEGIHVCQGNIWSQYAVDNGDGEGSVSYPYYLSREHFCKPAQGKEDMIDCVNLDGWTVDFLMARYAAPRFINGIRCGSRQGVGPIETVLRQGVELGTKEMLATTAAHFDTGFNLNNFAWVTCIWELGLVDLEERDRKTRTGLDGLEIWLNEMRRRWPEAKCITHGEFGLLWREEFKNNDSINYRFVQRGSGVCGSEPELEIRWFMNKDFRMALLRNWQENGPEKLIDFTRYDLPATEPDDPKPGESTRNWSLMNRLNQKGTREQDKPVDFGQISPDEQKMIQRRYPELNRSAPTAMKPLKVYILAGQSNMQGSAHLKTFKAIGDDPETSSLLNVILDKKGDPVACDNAWISYITQFDSRDTVLTGKVGVGYGFDHERIGPEYAFGLWMDKAHDEPILIIKTAWGGKSLAVDFRPPGAGPYVPSVKEKEQGNVPKDDQVGYYYREMVRHVRATLSSPESIRKVVPGYNPEQGFELAGFVWFQGWNDMCNRHHISQYTENMIHFIHDVRAEFNKPNLPFIVGILGVYGTDPDSRKYDKTLPVSEFRKVQLAGVEQYDTMVAEEYRGNVKALDSGPFYELTLSDIYWKQRLTNEWKWRVKQGEMTPEEARKERERYGFPKGGLTREEQRTWDREASNAEYHYLGSGKTFVRLGKAFAEAMLGMERN